MKRILSVITVLAFCLGLAACGGSKEKSEDTVLADAVPMENSAGTAASYASRTLASANELGLIELTCPADGGIYAVCSGVDADGEYVTRLCFVSSDGAVKEIAFDSLNGGGISAMCAGNGGLWLVRSLPVDADSSEYELWSLTGDTWSIHGTLDISGGLTPTAICAIGNRMLIALSDYQSAYILAAYNTEGRKDYELDIGTRFAIAGDGEKLYIGTQGRLDRQLTLSLFDPDSRELTELTSFDSGFLLSCAGSKVYVGDSTSAFAYDCGTGDIYRLFQWESCGIASAGAALYPDGADRFFVCGREGIKSVSLESGGVRQQVVLAINAPPGLYSSAVIAFNESNTEYEVVIRDYSSYQEPQQILGAEMAADNGPDLIDILSFSGDILHSNIMTDLMSYLETDADIGPEDLLSGPLRAMTTEDGKLLAIAPLFYVCTFLCRTGTVDTREFTGVIDGLKRLGTPDEAFAGTCSREDFLALAFCCNKKIEYSLDELTAILEFAAALPETADYSAWTENLISGRQKVTVETLGSAMQLMFSLLDLYESTDIGELTALGLPFHEGTGTVIPLMYLAIPTSAEHSDGAWAFIKSLLLQEGAFENEYPLLKANYEAAKEYDEELIRRGAKTTYTREGTEVEYTFQDTDCAGCYALSDYILDGVNGIFDADATILDIVKSSAASYFAGQRSAEDAAKSIQSRVSIYLGEQN